MVPHDFNIKLPRSLPLCDLAGIGVFSQPCAGAEPAGESQPGPVFLTGVTYGIANGVELKLNIALPRDSASMAKRYPLLIFIHGGGWQTGNRAAYNGRICEAAERGYVAATISHRLTADKDETGHPRYPWPAAIHDCKAAVRFLKTYADRFHIDPQRIGVTGALSGGHLALLLGLTDESDGLEGDVKMPNQENLAIPVVTNTRVQAVFNKSGPTDLVSCHADRIVKPFLEDLLGSFHDHRDRYVEASPINYISADDPPVMTIHGERDSVVSVEQARKLDQNLSRAGVSHQYLELAGERHVFTRAGGTKYWEAFYQFFDKQFR